MLKALPVPLLNVLKLIGVIVGTLGALYVLAILFNFVAPFVVAFIIAMAINPLVMWLSRKRKITLSRSLASLIATMTAVLAVSLVLLLVGSLLVSQATDIINLLPQRFPSFQDSINTFIAGLDGRMSILPDQLIQGLQGVIAELGAFISSYTGDVALFLFDFASLLPLGFVFIILAVLSTYFFSKDYDSLRLSLKQQVPESWVKQYRIIKRDMLAALFGYFKATVIFSAVSFVQLFIGFLILKVQYAFILAVIIALFDALPALGTGLFLVPWSLYALLIGDHKLAAGLLILNVLVVVVRQIISPKILGKQFGIHPISTMISMYVGLKVLGVVGLIFGPVILLILQSVLGYYTHGRNIREVIYGKHENM